jgi:hypothetical protein
MPSSRALLRAAVSLFFLVPACSFTRLAIRR